MKLLFFSDVHGGAAALERLFAWADGLKPDRLILLGDALDSYGMRSAAAEAATAAMLNSRKDSILAVRGNCDSEETQELLEFPILADYETLQVGTVRFFLTHGHIWNERNLPTVEPGTVLAQGHTHVPVIRELGCRLTLFNPGSLSMPRGGHPPTFGFFDGQALSVRRLEDDSIYLPEAPGNFVERLIGARRKSTS